MCPTYIFILSFKNYNTMCDDFLQNINYDNEEDVEEHYEYRGCVEPPIRKDMTKPGIYLPYGETDIPMSEENRSVFARLNIPYKIYKGQLNMLVDIWLDDNVDTTDERVIELLQLYEKYDSHKIIFQTYHSDGMLQIYS